MSLSFYILRKQKMKTDLRYNRSTLYLKAPLIKQRNKLIPVEG